MEKEAAQNIEDQKYDERTRQRRRHRFGLDNAAARVVLGLIVLVTTLYSLQGYFPEHIQVCHRSLSVEERAKKILKKHPLIDGHNDFLLSVRIHNQNHIYEKDGNDFNDKFENGGLYQHTDIPRLEKGMQSGAFWSAFWICPLGEGTNFSDDRYYDIVKGTLGQLDLYSRLGEAYPKYFTSPKNSKEAIHNYENGKFIAPVIIEGLHQIGNYVSNLRLYHRLGVRYATLTWNCHNKFADAAIEVDPGFKYKVAKPYWHGLSPAGRDIVVEMNRLGMIVDLAHVSQDTMRDVLVGKGDGNWTGSLAPPFFSHSSAYAICPHPRNVPDDILQLVKQRNSVVMVNFNPEFISCLPAENPGEFPQYFPANNTLQQVVRHIRHIGELIGYDHVGIGTDYNGIDDVPRGLEDVSKFPDLIAELLRQGVCDKDVAKVAGLNALRIWKEVDRVSLELQKTLLPLEDELSGVAAMEMPMRR